MCRSVNDHAMVEGDSVKSNVIIPCLWLDDQAEEAAKFYLGVFPGGRIVATSHYPSSSDNPAGKPRGSVMTVEFEIAGQRFSALNGGPIFTINPSISFFYYAETAADVDRVYASLADGGQALMPIGSYPWSERYGWIKDRYGVSWQIMLAQRGVPGNVIATSLMFTGNIYGRAEEALKLYAQVFPDGHVENVARYAAGEGPAANEGKVKYGRASVAGQGLVAMDSYGEHKFTFNEGLSLQVMCQNQAEVDHYWDRLGEGGEYGPCGWLKDRFGVSWQIVPTSMAEWMNIKDELARDRAFQAMMGMTKLDIATLEAAIHGK